MILYTQVIDFPPYEITFCTDTTSDGYFVYTILYPDNTLHTESMQYESEKQAKEKAIEDIKEFIDYNDE